MDAEGVVGAVEVLLLRELLEGRGFRCNCMSLSKTVALGVGRRSGSGAGSIVVLGTLIYCVSFRFKITSTIYFFRFYEIQEAKLNMIKKDYIIKSISEMIKADGTTNQREIEIAKKLTGGLYKLV